MDPVAVILGTSWTLTGVVIIVVSIPLALGRVGRNRFYGVRLSQSFRSDDAWLAINQFGGKRMIAWSVPLVLVGIICFFLSLQSHPALTLALGFVPCVCLFIPLLETWRFARGYQPRIPRS